MAPGVSNTLRQKAEAADAANHAETQRLAGLYEARLAAAAGPVEEAELRRHLERLLVHLAFVRPRLAADLRVTLDLLVRVATRNGADGPAAEPKP